MGMTTDPPTMPPIETWTRPPGPDMLAGSPADAWEDPHSPPPPVRAFGGKVKEPERTPIYCRVAKEFSRKDRSYGGRVECAIDDFERLALDCAGPDPQTARLLKNPKFFGYEGQLARFVLSYETDDGKRAPLNCEQSSSYGEYTMPR